MDVDFGTATWIDASGLYSKTFQEVILHLFCSFA